MDIEAVNIKAMNIRIDRVTTLEECEVCQKLARQVWGNGAACSVPQMIVHARYGGVVLLARSHGTPVGFLFSFPARYRDEWVLWSHETAVLPEWMHQGIGTYLKQVQRDIAADIGYDSIVWTFDPLVARNAHFNLNKLGAVIVEYRRNVYGMDESDLVNLGIETDRFVAAWPLHVDPLKNVRPALSALPVPPAVLLDIDAEGAPLLRRREVADIAVATSVPADYGALIASSRPLGQEWRMAFREAAETLFRRGYVPRTLVRNDRNRGMVCYIWTRVGGERSAT